MRQPRVKIVAIASNEGRYLPQWLYHHAYMGFQGFDIYVNRTFDKTKDILKKLASSYHNLTVYDSNWIDIYFKNNPPFSFIQAGPYLQSYYNSQEDYDYILYLDIDEFWMPLNCRDTIQDCIINLDYPDCLIFEWYYIGGRHSNLDPLFSTKHFFGHCGDWIKYMIKTGLRPTSTGVHIPKFESIDRVVLADGDRHKINHENISILHPTQRKKLRNYFILHDAMRTPLNSLSKLRRGRAALGKCNELKNMATIRPIFYYMDNNKNQQPFCNTLPKDYYEGYRKLVHHLQLNNEMHACEVVEHLMALDGIRILKSKENDSFTKKIIDKFGTLESIHTDLLQSLANLDSSYEDIVDLPIMDDSFIKSDNIQDDTGYMNAIKLYPYAVDKEYHPMFLKLFIKKLIIHRKLDQALQILHDSSIISNNIYGTDWAAKFIEDLYESLGLYSEAQLFRNKTIYS